MKTKMTELEKAELLLKLFKENKEHFKFGLCDFIHRLFTFKVVEYEIYDNLYWFISDNNPIGKPNRLWYSMFRKENKYFYYFKPGNYKRRLKYLKSLVKKYSKK